MAYKIRVCFFGRLTEAFQGGRAGGAAPASESCLPCDTKRKRKKEAKKEKEKYIYIYIYILIP